MKLRLNKFQAVYLNLTEEVRLLLTRDDLDLNPVDNIGQSALDHACRENKLEIVEMLIQRDDLLING